MTYTYNILDTTEDGDSLILIYNDEEDYRATYWVRCDHARQWAEQEVGILNAMEANPGDCEHGLSAALCRGPSHY